MWRKKPASKDKNRLLGQGWWKEERKGRTVKYKWGGRWGENIAVVTPEYRGEEKNRGGPVVRS